MSNFWDWFEDFAAPKLSGNLSARDNTFRQMFEHLDEFDRPVLIVETGTVEDPNNWLGNGCSTLLFDRYVTERGDGSRLLSVDINKEVVAAARKLVSERTEIVCDDSVSAIEQWVRYGIPEVIDLLYLDGSHLYWDNHLPSAIHHHAELIAALPKIGPRTLVAVDDSPARFEMDFPRMDVIGKGKLVAEHMLMCGADLEFCEYQTGWTNVRGLPVEREDDDIKGLIERARRHVDSNKPLAAESLYRIILGSCTPPTNGTMRIALGEACAFYAGIFLLKNKYGSAAEWYREALRADPLANQYRVDLARRCLVPMGNLKVALEEAERATKIDPSDEFAWKVVGEIWHDLANEDRCKEAYDRRLALVPDSHDAIIDVATMALDTCDYDKVRECCDRIFRDGGDRVADAIHCMAMVAYREHRHEDAIGLYDKALALNCRDRGMTRWNKSLALHCIGKYREGWVEHEERANTRINPALWVPMKRFTVPLWDGTQPAKKEDGSAAVVHVHCEAGAGDNLCCSRYLPMIAELGYEVHYETQDDMVDIMSNSFPGVEILRRAPDYPGALGLKPFDYHCPIGSLPAIFKTEVDTVPWKGPYLRANPTLADAYKQALDTHMPHRTFSVGICWSAGIRQGVWITRYGRSKSGHFNDFRGIVDAVKAAGGLPVSLQVGPERSQNEGVILDVLPKYPTWNDTAALVSNLDIVISIDTGVAHLAGGMGKRLWVMCQKDAYSWHFLCWRPGAPWNESSPWYPSARLFRQHEYDTLCWDDVVADIVDELGSVGVRRNVAAE